MIKTALLFAGLTFYASAAAQTIKIGLQEWMSKNLDVEKYRNGDPIPQVQDTAQWSKLTTGAWCYYEAPGGQSATYGKMYNWYAVNDPRGLAPKGYHIPSKKEYDLLKKTLGGEGQAGHKLKSTHDWNSFEGKEGNGSNESKFDALPGGLRNGDGSFAFIGDIGHWWSSTTMSGNLGNCYEILLSRKSGLMSGGYVPKNFGMAVRCVKD